MRPEQREPLQTIILELWFTVTPSPISYSRSSQIGKCLCQPCDFPDDTNAETLLLQVLGSFPLPPHRAPPPALSQPLFSAPWQLSTTRLHLETPGNTANSQPLGRSDTISSFTDPSLLAGSACRLYPTHPTCSCRTVQYRNREREKEKKRDSACFSPDASASEQQCSLFPYAHTHTYTLTNSKCAHGP